MQKKPIVWTIAGSDSGGGAGIQADLHTFNALDTYGCSVITALTAQNSYQVRHIEWTAPIALQAQLEALQVDLPAQVIKVGMACHPQVIAILADFLAQFPVKVVCDPVMLTSSGASFMGSLEKETATKKDSWLAPLFPYIDILTPNIAEAEILSGIPIVSTADMKQAANSLVQQGVKSVLLKGGHLQGDQCLDYWTNGQQSFWLVSPKQHSPHTHGSGCTLSAAIAATLALGYALEDALVIAKMYVNQSIRHAQAYGRGPGPVSHLGWPKNWQDFPTVVKSLEGDLERAKPPTPFPDCGPLPLGIYPLVDSTSWLEHLLSLGITTIQLRLKNQSLASIELEIARGVELAKHYSARLFINDYWQLALKYGAYGVHLGQQDIQGVDCKALAQANIRLGISAHSYYEIAQAKSFRPSYIALGPIFPTTSKFIPFAPLGLARLRRWCQTLKNYPVVAIGGINQHNIAQVIACGVDGVAVISAITQATEPASAVRQLMQASNFRQRNTILHNQDHCNK